MALSHITPLRAKRSIFSKTNSASGEEIKDELAALEFIKRRVSKLQPNVSLGIGDDAAALIISPGKLLLATADSQVEGVHFIRGLISPATVARRAVAAAVSDIAAMGGDARFILSSLGLPRDLESGFFEALAEGLQIAEEEFGVSLVGGNLSSADKLFLDISVLGEVEPDIVVKRDGASVGDSIFITGTLGDSALGLELLKGGIHEGAADEFLIARHRSPLPRLGVGRALALAKIPSAMIDVSDGFTLDLERITIHQGLGAQVYLEKIPLSEAYKDRAHRISADFFAPALSGGEDYELLFTAAQAARGEIAKISGTLRVQITEIGRVTGEARIRIVDSRGVEPAPTRRGFIHFHG
ncbi:MAG: thiamine-phosphate kinase [Deltaproteobacteria bacterium]